MLSLGKKAVFADARSVQIQAAPLSHLYGYTVPDLILCGVMRLPNRYELTLAEFLPRPTCFTSIGSQSYTKKVQRLKHRSMLQSEICRTIRWPGHEEHQLPSSICGIIQCQVHRRQSEPYSCYSVCCELEYGRLLPRHSSDNSSGRRPRTEASDGDSM